MVNANKTHKVYLVIIMPKDLLKHVLILLPLETILMIMLKNAGKKRLFEKIRKNKIRDKSPTLSKTVLTVKFCQIISVHA